MELWLKVPSESWEDFQTLESRGLCPQLYKGHMEARFPTSDGGKISGLPITAQYFIRNWERGGGMTNTGEAKVICDTHGKKLKPEKVFTNGHLSNKIHAEFDSQHGHEITCTKRGVVTILYYQLAFDYDDDHIGIQIIPIWKGPIASIPNKFGFLKVAADTAFKKANTFHCRIAMYIKDVGETK